MARLDGQEEAHAEGKEDPEESTDSDSDHDVTQTESDPAPANPFELPTFQEAYRPDGGAIVWGEKTFDDISAQLQRAYDVVANGFRKNVFKLPSGRNGKNYILEMVRLTKEWNRIKRAPDGGCRYC